jgi:hypothetical protein
LLAARCGAFNKLLAKNKKAGAIMSDGADAPLWPARRERGVAMIRSADEWRGSSIPGIWTFNKQGGAG